MACGAVFVAKRGGEGIRPYLRRLYAARVATIQAAGREFVEGYRCRGLTFQRVVQLKILAVPW